METRSRPSPSIRPEDSSHAEDTQRPLPFLTMLVVVVVNLIPMFGVLFGRWKLGEVMGLFWAESVVIGFYTLLKIAVVTKEAAIFYGMIFLWIFGFFTAIQFKFVYELFVLNGRGSAPGALEALTNLFLPIWPALVALLLSHGASFVLDFLARREYEGATFDQLILVPQVRMILMQFTIIFGAWVVVLLHSPLPAMVLLVLFKMRVDFKLMTAA